MLISNFGFAWSCALLYAHPRLHMHTRMHSRRYPFARSRTLVCPYNSPSTHSARFLDSRPPNAHLHNSLHARLRAHPPTLLHSLACTIANLLTHTHICTCPSAFDLPIVFLHTHTYSSSLYHPHTSSLSMYLHQHLLV